MLTVATWNVNSLRVRQAHVVAWLQNHQPDLLALQEIKMTSEQFPADDFLELGYHAVVSGQKTYNGVAILSRIPPASPQCGIPDYSDPQQRVIAADYGPVTLLNLYVPNGSEVGSEKYLYKLDWFDRLHPYIRQLLKEKQHLVIVGDFNVAPADIDVHDPEEWAGKVLVSDAERAEFRKLIDHGLVDCYRMLDSNPGAYSWWDYRAAAFRRNRGLRIDHILADKALGQQLVACSIDTEPRTLERPSDHTPVVASFDIDIRQP